MGATRAGWSARGFASPRRRTAPTAATLRASRATTRTAPHRVLPKETDWGRALGWRHIQPMLYSSRHL